MRKFTKTLAAAASLLAVSLSPSYADVVQAKLNGNVLKLTGGNFRITLVNAPAICGFANNLGSVRTVIRSGNANRVNVSLTNTAPCTKLCMTTPAHGFCGIFLAADVRSR